MSEYETLSQLLDAYGEYLSARGKNRVSIVVHKNPVRKLIQFAETKGITKVKGLTEKILKEYQTFLYDERDFSEGTAKTYSQYVAMFFDFLIETGRAKDNPARGIEILKKTDPPEKQFSHFYTFDEVLRRYLNDQEKWVSIVAPLV